MPTGDSTNPIERRPAHTEVVGRSVDATLDQPSGDRNSLGEDTIAQVEGDPNQLAAIGKNAGRYRILKAHARGGLGEVFVAEDTELGRQVALKEILPRADHAENRARFVLEAEITGGLEHPGIVPVYGLGQYADGRPFYAMRFIAGESLRKAIQRFHEQKKPFTSLEFRSLLGRFVAMCQAVAFAHSRGVLHRDLKPDNVMLGKFGETLVVDWGLAKSTGQSELADAGEVALQPRSATDSTATVVGQALGTPAYMAPEQAAGRFDELGPPADIYSLGATLYELLTGRVAFQAKYVQMVLEDISASRFPRPRKVNPLVPRALEAVCLKAMSASPADRYPTAVELAADVEHWLADEPVAAYREPIFAQIGRWIRRHRTLVGSTAVLLTMAAVGLTIGIVLVSREQARTAQERDEKEIARQLAVDNERKAVAARNAESAARRRTREALNTLTDDVIEKLLAKQVQLGDNEKRFLQRVQKFYEEFAVAGGETPESKTSQLDGLFRLANIHVRLGQTREAERAYRESLALCLQLTSENRDVREYQENLALIRSNLGNLLSDLGQQTEAESMLRAALPIQIRLAQDHPANADHRSALARTRANLGVLLREMKRPAETESEYLAALEIRSQLVVEHPTVAAYRQELARIRTNLGALYTELNRRDEAMQQYREALAQQKRLMVEFPNVPLYRQDLAATNNNLGNLLTELRRLDEAETVYREALAAKKQLVADFPSIPEYRRDLAVSLTNFGILLKNQRKTDEAVAVLREALMIRSRLAADDPKTPAYRQELARTHASLAALLRDSKRTKEAEDAFRAALAIRIQLGEENPKDAEAAADTAKTYINLALMKRAEHDLPEYRRSLEAAVPLLKSAIANAPAKPSFRELYHFGLTTLAPAQLIQGDHAAAFQVARELAELNWKPAEDRITAAGILAHCVAFCQKDPALSEISRTEATKQYVAQCVVNLREAYQSNPQAVVHAAMTSDYEALRDDPSFTNLLWELAG